MTVIAEYDIHYWIIISTSGVLPDLKLLPKSLANSRSPDNYREGKSQV